MAKSMVIVESPAKARTIERYLGKDYVVKACAGHIKDLPKTVLGVDIENDFQPTYRVISGKAKIVNELKKAAGRSQDIYLAADPDREGEAICQHLAEELNSSKDRRFHRILFNEITQKAIQEAFQHPSQINRDKVEAQQARRILDRLVGYKVSPLLWRNVRRGLSAGRVQSVALRMIVEREKEIREFVAEEYWNFAANLAAKLPPPFTAKAVKVDGKKFKIDNPQEADELLEALRAGDFVVSGIKKKERRRNPVPPYVTSTLQQEASRRLRFTVRKTMTLAQRLYEGVQLGDQGRVGLITYMRTDSTRVAGSALSSVREYIQDEFGAKYLPPKARFFKGKKSAQDAHEAIRPTEVSLSPQAVKPYLERDQFRLYQLIWKRFVASQMNPAVFDQTEIEIDAPRTLFKAVGSILRFDGFLKVYEEQGSQSQKTAGAEGKDKILPPVEKGEVLRVEAILPEQKFTQPPPRYNEASLVKALEENGIGRPSTYAQILTVIQDREYVNKDEGRFVPTETGEVVAEMLVKNFEEIFNYDYTARLEKDLDGIESGRKNWVATLRDFYGEFSKELEEAGKKMKNLKREEVPAGVTCDKCGSEMVIKWGRFGRFVACSNYPECRNTRQLARSEEANGDKESSEQGHEPCEKCGREMVLKKGRYGEFLACSGYPECKNTRKLVQVNGKTEIRKDELLDEKCPRCESQLAKKHGRFGEFTACSNYPDCRYIKQETTGVTCPLCNEGEIVQKKSRRGRIFYSCNAYPNCKFVLWQKPVPSSCPKCDASYVLEKQTKKEGLIRYCGESECSWRQEVEPAPTG